MKLEANFTVKLPHRLMTYSCSLTGNVWGVFGPSGSGKTTFFHSLAGLRKPSSGKIIINDIPVFEEGRLHTPPQKRRIGYVFQDYRLFPHLSVLGNLRFGESLGKKSRMQPDLKTVMELFELQNIRNRMIPELSGGEMQRVAIARALLCGPEMLLLDEPFKGLDALRKRKHLLIFRELIRRQQLNVIFISHDIDDILSLTENLILIDNGTLIAQDTYSNLLKDKTTRLSLEQPRVYHKECCCY